MESGIVAIEESETTEIGPRNTRTSGREASYLYLLIIPSPKTDQIEQGTEVVYKGTRFKVAQKAATGTPGEPIEFALITLKP